MCQIQVTRLAGGFQLVLKAIRAYDILIIDAYGRFGDGQNPGVSV